MRISGTISHGAAFLYMARIVFNDFREPAAAAAYDIALDFLLRSGAVRDEYETSIFLAQSLTAMVDEGQSNKIAMANHAISACQKRLAG